jgi:hypothetical protein
MSPALDGRSRGALVGVDEIDLNPAAEVERGGEMQTARLTQKDADALMQQRCLLSTGL